MQDGAINMEMGEDGNLRMVGEDIDVPLSQINRIPQPIPMAEPLEILAKGPLAAIGNGEWNDDTVYESMDQLFGADTAQNERILKSIAVDRMNIPLEQANELLNQQLETPTKGGATNALEAQVEQALYNTAKVEYDAKQLEIAKAQQAEAFKQAQINNLNRRVNNGVSPNQQQRLNQINGMADSYTKNYAQLQNLFTQDENGMAAPKSQDSITAINQVLKNFGGHNIEEIVYQPGGEEGGANWYNPFSWGDKPEMKEGEFLIYRKGGKEPTPANYSDLLQVIGRTQFGLDSPFNASRGARKAAQNQKTKAAHAARTSAQWDERRDDKKDYGDLALSAVKAIPGAALLGTAGSVISDAAGTGVGKIEGKARGKIIEKAVKAVGGSAKAAAKATGAVGLALAAKDIADTFNKVQYQGMTPEEQQKRRTITASQRRGKK